MDIELYKKILKQYGMTYEDLANQTGLSLGCIKRILAGIARYPRADTIELIEKALNINSNYLTAEERAAGAALTVRKEITPLEDDMLYVFREVGKKFGEPGQRAIIVTAENMLKLK